MPATYPRETGNNRHTRKGNRQHSPPQILSGGSLGYATGGASSLSVAEGTLRRLKREGAEPIADMADDRGLRLTVYEKQNSEQTYARRKSGRLYFCCNSKSAAELLRPPAYQRNYHSRNAQAAIQRRLKQLIPPILQGVGIPPETKCWHKGIGGCPCGCSPYWTIFDPREARRELYVELRKDRRPLGERNKFPV